MSLFYYLFDGDPEPRDGFLQLSDDVPGLGVSVSAAHAGNFDIVEE